MVCTRGLHKLAIVLGLLAVLSEGVVAQQVLQLTLQQAAQMGLVQLTGKGGYLGDKVAVDAVNNISAVPIQITAQIGDVLANKNSSEQALVVTKNLNVVLGPGQSIRLGGLFTMCIQRHKSAPSGGTTFDVAPNLASWSRYPAAARLLEFLLYVDAHGLHESTSAQQEVWSITSGAGFPREILTPNAQNPLTSFVVPLDEDGNPIGDHGIDHGIEDFETCDFSRFPWETGGDADWFVTSDQAHSGHCSARAGRIGHYGDSYLEISTTAEGSISFWYKVSSEYRYDELCFYVNGDVVDCWSGEIDWSYAEYPLPPGYYTFTWVYRKDGSTSSGYDTAWLDDISFGAGIVPTCGEPNDDFATACPISLPFSGRFAIDHSYDRDFFRFTLTSYAEVSVEVFAERIGSYLDSYVCLYDVDGHTLACNNDYYGDDSYINVHLGPGSYFVEVRPYSGSGAYELRVQARGGH
jgi:uncharacterized protein YdbL (DUF1318 family)